MCFDYFLQILSENIFHLTRIYRDIMIDVHLALCKVQLVMSDLNKK
jgi:hypothetical protein